MQPPFSLAPPNDVQSVALLSKNIQVTSKGSDQTARMRRLIRGFAVRKYYTVGNLMSWLIILSFYISNTIINDALRDLKLGAMEKNTAQLQSLSWLPV